MTERITHWDGPPLEAWAAWHPREVASRLSGIAIPWCVVGGWAIDLWLGGETRAHSDLEIAIVRQDFGVIRHHLLEFRLHVVGDGEVRALARDAMPPLDKHQIWVLDETANAWRMDVMLEPGDASTWVFRRDERVRAPRNRMLRERDRIPFLAPEGVLLFKAKRLDSKDAADFAQCLPTLDEAARRWLIDALVAVHPEHPWIAQLRATSGR